MASDNTSTPSAYEEFMNVMNYIHGEDTPRKRCTLQAELPFAIHTLREVDEDSIAAMVSKEAIVAWALIASEDSGASICECDRH